MRFATSNGTSLGKTIVVRTPKTYPQALKEIKKAFQILTKQGRIKLVVGGVPRFTRDKLTYWYTNPAEKEIEKICLAKVVIENDAALAAVAEAQKGAGNGEAIVAYLTYSSGFGGARVVTGMIDRNSLGFEPKLQVSNFKPGGKIKPISSLVSGRGILRMYHKRGEKLADKKAWHKIEQWMETTINDAIVFWSPDVVVLGGPVALNKNISAARIQKFINQRFGLMPKTPKIKKAKLGQMAGLIGAMIRARQLSK